ncbi:MAG TPA: hypothetical protein VN515_06505 [Terriglobales bacterium]|nr:hypothetical protein [Terriglobales bacterium]
MSVVAYSTLASSDLRESAYRDHAVDLIKGWACLLMVVAHVPFPDARWLSWTTMGSVLFFSSTGMNLWGLVARQRGDYLRIAANGLFLIFAGFADNYVLGTMGQSDVFQSAGMAMIAMLALHWMLPRTWTWLFPLPFLIHYANQHFFFWKISAGGVSSFFLTPGLFPLLPWLSFYLLGAHLKRYPERRMRWGIGLGALAACGVAVAATGWRLDKFWMSPEYWFLGLAYTALLLDGLRVWLARCRRPSLAELRYWGANSLVFYILHGFVIRLLEIWLPGGWLLLVAALSLTAVLMRAGLWLQHWARTQSPWAILAGCGGVSAAVLGMEAVYLHAYYARTFLSFGLTLSFLAAYPAFKLLSQRLPALGVQSN